ncbi:hypothetical protein M426DRAFT_322026 [Hypoxylon sp. CI-4A]|nr:hypothetical protein M426DRAFT_322026 [Hypoxylon sp. CI-4A]
MAPLCRFWQQGYCRNGSSCRFEHPAANANSNPFSAPNSNANRFSALDSGGNRTQSQSQSQNQNQYKFTEDSIRLDLLKERPQWLLSCYAPGKDTPEQLFGGYPREQSLEEVMLHIRGSSNPQQAEAEVGALMQQAEQQNQTALNNLNGAIQFVLDAENKHPNRIDICKQSAPQGTTAGIFARDAVPSSQAGFSNPIASNPFSAAPSGPQANPFSGGTPAFGQPSAMGQRPNPFAAGPAATAAPTSTFGQPSAMGASQPVFGQSSQLGAATPAFGQTSALGQKPNPFSSGPTTSAPTGFGQPAQGTSAFGQPSALGQRPNPFGAPPATSAPNPFSSQAATTTTPSPFSQPAAVNPFAQVTSPPANDQSMDTSATPVAPVSNPFAQPSTSPFGATTPNPFAAQKPSGFGAALNNPFAQAQTQQQPQQPQQQAQNQGQSAPVSKANPYPPNSTKQHPPPESYIVKSMDGRITSFNGQHVVYKWKINDRYQDPTSQEEAQRNPRAPGVRGADGSWRKIFFPEGPPGYNKDTEPDPSKYTAAVKAAYANMTATGRFNGYMPEVPPMREDCVWNF